MKQQLQLSIPNPCKQSWSEMAPKGRGRHCQKCDRVIVDFSHSTDRHLLDAIAKNGTHLCGRFAESQLNRPLIASSPVARTFDLRAVILGLGILACTPVFASPNVSHHFSLTEIIATDTRIATEDSLQLPEKIVSYRLNLVDAITGEPVIFAKILVLDASGNILLGAYSDFDGSALLQIPSGMDSQISSIQIKTTVDEHIEFSQKWESFKLNQSHDIELAPSHSMIIEGIIISPSPSETFDIHNPRPSDTWKRPRPGSRD